MANAASLERYLYDPRMRIGLDIISRAEGTHGAKDPYRVYGGSKQKQLASLAAHPGAAGSWKFKWNDGRVDNSTAAGRYQMVSGTWGSLANRYGLKDFSPRNQDLAAIALIKEKGALPDILRGDYHSAMRKLGTIWASLPSSKYAQAKRNQKQFDAIVAAAQGNSAPAPLPVSGFTAPAPAMVQPTLAPLPKADPMVAGIADLNPYQQLNRDELNAIMPLSVSVPTTTESFFEPVKVDWGLYYG